MILMALISLSMFSGGTWVLAQSQAPGQVQMKIPLPNQPEPMRQRSGQPFPPSGSDPFKTGADSAKSESFKTGEKVPAAPVTQVFNSDSSAYDSLLTEEIIRQLRDPFQPPAILTKKEAPKEDLELFRLSDIRLNGVITGPNRVRAMVSTPGNKTYFVAVGDKVGNRLGRVTAIQQDLIKIVEYEEDGKGRRIPELFELRLNGELVSLSSKED
jgi:hypothetical protein